MLQLYVKKEARAVLSGEQIREEVVEERCLSNVTTGNHEQLFCQQLHHMS